MNNKGMPCILCGNVMYPPSKLQYPIRISCAKCGQIYDIPPVQIMKKTSGFLKDVSINDWTGVNDG